MNHPQLVIPRFHASAGGLGFFFGSLFGMIGISYLLMAWIFFGPQGDKIGLPDKLGGFAVLSTLALASAGFYWYAARGEHIRLTPHGIALLRGNKVERELGRDAIHFIAVVTTQPQGASSFVQQQITLADAARLGERLSLGTTMIFVSSAPANGDVVAFLNGSWQRPADRRDLITFHPRAEAVEWVATHFRDKVV